LGVSSEYENVARDTGGAEPSGRTFSAESDGGNFIGIREGEAAFGFAECFGGESDECASATGTIDLEASRTVPEAGDDLA
jgi:hypothetical protein